MDGFVPGLRENILALSGPLRVVVYFLCVAGLILRVHRAQPSLESVARPVVRAVGVVALVSTLPSWFGGAEQLFMSVADAVESGYADHPMRAATMIRERTTETGTTFSLRRLEESYYRATLWAASKFVIMVGTVLQLPFLLLQHVLKLLCLLFLPVALGLFMVPSLEGLAVRYLQQTCAVLAWPVGFAVTELVAYNLGTSFDQSIAGALGLTSTTIDASSMANLFGGLLGALWLIIGTVATPVLMQMLFCSGVPWSDGSREAMGAFGGVKNAVMLIAAAKTGGATAVAALTRGAATAAATQSKNAPNDGPPKARTTI